MAVVEGTFLGQGGQEGESVVLVIRGSAIVECTRGGKETVIYLLLSI